MNRVSSLKTTNPNITDTHNVLEGLASLEKRFRSVFSQLITDPDFVQKYDITYNDAIDGAFFYLFTTRPSAITYVIEAFPVVCEQSANDVKRVEELTYHKMFEDVIERYTKSRKKPNPVLMETRSSSFCYLLTIKIEVLPLDQSHQAINFTLLREFKILQHIWENYSSNVASSKCNVDQLIGFPMPFEFRNVQGTEYDLPQDQTWKYYTPAGKLESVQRVSVPNLGPPASECIKSTMSYMSLERVGPSLNYLMDLMRAQRKCFSVSSALRIYDQLICRLMVMHKFSVIHGDVNPKAFSFGTGVALNVLYLNNFETALIAPTFGLPLPFFHDRFVSYSCIKERTAHFVHDLESAFYVFLYLMLGRLPWDSRLAAQDSDSVMSGADNSVRDARSEKCRTMEDKERFWHSSNQLMRIVRSIEMEVRDKMYRNFASDIIAAMYTRVKETISTCHSIAQTTYAKDIVVIGSASYNAYFGVRKIIASYFRFESRNNALKDLVWQTKTDAMLRKDANDRRMAWDLSYWCWNYLEATANPSSSTPSGGPLGPKSLYERSAPILVIKD